MSTNKYEKLSQKLEELLKNADQKEILEEIAHEIEILAEQSYRRGYQLSYFTKKPQKAR